MQKGVFYRDAAKSAHLKVSFSDEGTRRFLEEEVNYGRLKEIIQRLGFELKEVIKQKEELQQLLQKKGEDVDSLTNLVTVLEDECTHNTAINKQLGQECSEYLEENERLQMDVKMLQQENARIHEELARVKLLQEERTMLATEKQDLVMKVKEVEREKENDKNRLDNMLKRVQQHRDELQEELAHHSKEMDGIKKENKMLKAKLEGADFTLSEESCAFEQQQKDWKEERDQLFNKVQGYENRCLQMEAKFNVFAKRDADRERRCMECEKRVKGLERDYTAAVEERNRLQRDNLVLMEMYEELVRDRRGVDSSIGGSTTGSPVPMMYSMGNDIPGSGHRGYGGLGPTKDRIPSPSTSTTRPHSRHSLA
eukprot:TRINITY_DN67138_c11_g1_i1.p1 TRINITY_DN67138_c11_g1~~TRINITY_DN67138_c11_g1_i1.p1  ORF type:complete len:367 (-),score=42.15 TRINITY_DN67138_c11_g1_i1:1324-2424(-)